MVEEEVAKDVAALNSLCVGCIIVFEIRILCSNPTGGDIVCPKPVLLAVLASVHCCAGSARRSVVLVFSFFLKPDVV
jgi:hypothetical protein